MSLWPTTPQPELNLSSHSDAAPAATAAVQQQSGKCEQAKAGTRPAPPLTCHLSLSLDHLESLKLSNYLEKYFLIPSTNHKIDRSQNPFSSTEATCLDNFSKRAWNLLEIWMVLSV